MNPSDCPKYKNCNAPLCPRDDHWNKRVTCNNEGVCFFMREFVKGNKEGIGIALQTRIHKILVCIEDKKQHGYGYLSIALKRSAVHTSKRDYVPLSKRVPNPKIINFPSTTT